MSKQTARGGSPRLLSQRNDRQLTQAAAKLAEKAFRLVWNNPADAAYDRL